MTDTVDEIREILRHQISLKIFDRVENLLNFIGKLGQAGISF